MVDKSDRTTLDLRAGSLSESDVVVQELLGTEGISTPFQFSLTFRATGADELDLEALVGKSALLTARRPGGEERKVHGVLRSVTLAGVSAGRAHYGGELVPAFGLLDQTRDSRVFQNKSVLDIVKEILDARKVRFRLGTSASYLKREYCVQYQESDLAFVSRLLEEEGLFYFFEHADDHHTLVLADGVNGCGPIPGDATLPFRDQREAQDEQDAEHVFALERIHRERSGKATLRDFDFSQPDLDLTSSSEASDGADREVYCYPGGLQWAGRGKAAREDPSG
jgi:type VI secretion system secreted protein VgrG